MQKMIVFVILLLSLIYSPGSIALSPTATAQRALSEVATKIYINNYDCAYDEREADIIFAEQCGTKDNTYCKIKMFCRKKQDAQIATLPNDANVVVACKTDNDGFCPKDPMKCMSDNSIVVYRQNMLEAKPKLTPRVQESTVK